MESPSTLIARLSKMNLSAVDLARLQNLLDGQNSTNGSAAFPASYSSAKEAAATCAKMIDANIKDSSDLPLQQERTGLGRLLLKPLPLSTLDAIEHGAPVLADEFFPFVGGIDAYTTALSSVGTSSRAETPSRSSGAGIWQRQDSPALRCRNLSCVSRHSCAVVETTG